MVLLNERAFDVLVTLVERAGHLVTNDELLERVWRGRIVEESNVDVQISKLRKPLGKRAIENDRHHGYRFTLPVDAIDARTGLSLDMSALKARYTRPANLPAQATAFVGRENEIHAIRAQLADGPVRLLTLSGVAGIGKTRLALETAAGLVDEFEHGVFFVPLVALRDPALVLPTIAKVFDVREAADPMSRSPRIAGHLHPESAVTFSRKHRASSPEYAPRTATRTSRARSSSPRRLSRRCGDIPITSRVFDAADSTPTQSVWFRTRHAGWRHNVLSLIRCIGEPGHIQ
jgi:DNA-binding winged helix-turn-helix (wHTH) protein